MSAAGKYRFVQASRAIPAKSGSLCFSDGEAIREEGRAAPMWASGKRHDEAGGRQRETVRARYN